MKWGFTMKQTDFDNNEQPTKENKFKSHLGFYLTLLICLSAVAFAVWTTYTSITDYINPNNSTDNLTTSEQSVEKNVSDMPYSKPSGNNSDNSADNTSSVIENTNSKDTEKTNASVSSFLNSIIKKYSGENPVYSETFKDWRVHNGIDYKAEKGSEVPCVADGTVKNIYSDELMGCSVEIEDKEGYTYIYSGLENNLNVKLNDAVKKGYIIGTVGTIPSEIADKSHIHISVTKGGKYIDPSTMF